MSSLTLLSTLGQWHKYVKKVIISASAIIQATICLNIKDVSHSLFTVVERKEAGFKFKAAVYTSTKLKTLQLRSLPFTVSLILKCDSAELICKQVKMFNIIYKQL